MNQEFKSILVHRGNILNFQKVKNPDLYQDQSLEKNRREKMT